MVFIIQSKTIDGEYTRHEALNTNELKDFLDNAIVRGYSVFAITVLPR